MTDEHDDSDGTRIDVTGDRKPGRWVEVYLDRGVVNYGQADANANPWTVSLSIEDDGITGAVDTWTGLTPDEARAVADALLDAASDAEERNARDPRSRG
jgi:hypothetical protein